MKICFVKYPGKATLVEPSVTVAEQEQDQQEEQKKEREEEEEESGDINNNFYDCDDVVVCKEPLSANDDIMNSYEASWQECRLKWCLRSRSKERHYGSGGTGWAVEDDEEENCCDDGSAGRARPMADSGRRNPSEKRQACSSDSTGSSQEEQEAVQASSQQQATAPSRRPKAKKPLGRVQSVRHDSAAHRYRTRQRVAAEMLDEQRAAAAAAAADASAAAARDLCRSSAAKIKKSLSFRNPAAKKVAITGGDRLHLQPVSDDDHNNNYGRQQHQYNNHYHHHHHNNHVQRGYDDDVVEQQLQYEQQRQELLPCMAVDESAVAPAAATASFSSSSAAAINAPVSSAAPADGGQDNFAIPRPKLIVPVHTYGLRKRRTGNTISSNRTASDVNAASSASCSSTVASSSGCSSSSTSAAGESKKHHNSCPGKNHIFIKRIYLVSPKLFFLFINTYNKCKLFVCR